MPHSSRSRAAKDQAGNLLARSREGFLLTLRNAAAEVIRHPEWLASLTDAAGACFDELVGGRKSRRLERQHGIASINLVRDDESDYSIALINLDQRLQAYCAHELSALHLRMRLLLAEGGIALCEESPLGTASVCRALRAFKEAERLSAVEALQLLRQLDEPLRRHLSRFYRELEHSFADQALTGNAQGASRPAEDDDWTSTPAARASLPIHPVDALRLAVLGQREMMPESGASLDPGLASALLERAEAWLGERQMHGAGVPASLGASELGALLSPSKAAAVEVVETVCNRGAESPALPPAIRALFVGLRVPLLRLALRSETLLSLERHPALGLLDRIANVGRTLAPDSPPELPVCRGLASMVRSLGRLPRPVRRDFDMALAVTDSLLVSRRRRAETRAEVHVKVAARLERREVALHQASRAVYLLVGSAPASVASDFLERYWVHVLAKAVYRHGPDSPQWAARLLTASRLLASAVPPADAAAQQRLAVELPALAHDLEDGLAWIGLPAEQAQAALAACMELHACLIAGRAAPAPKPRRSSPLPRLGAPAESPNLRTLKHKHYVAGELPLPPEWAGLGVGDSVAVGLPDGSVMRGFVAHLSPGGQVMLISDGDYDRVLAITARALAQQVTLPATRIFRDESIVDEAAIDKLINP